MKKKILIIVSSILVILLIGGGVFYNKAFRFRDSGPTQPSEGNFVLRNKSNGKLIRPQDAKPNDGIALEAFTPRPWTCVAWKFKPQNDGSYILQNILSGKTFSTSEKNDEVIQTQIQGQNRYRFVPEGNMTYRIENINGLCLTAEPEDNHGAAHFHLSERNNSDNQKWEVISAPENLMGPVAKN